MSSAVPRPADNIDSRSFPEAAKVLVDCCEERTVCRFELVHNAYSTSVAMVKLHPQGLELRLSPDDVREPMLLQAICSISFSIGPTFCAFLGHLIDVRQPKVGERHVVVTVPRQLTATNLRQSFRVPVIRNSGLEVLVQFAGQQPFTVTACDIAEAGIEIDFGSSDLSNLTIGTVLDVELRFRGEVVHKRGEVRRMVGRKIGIAFSILADENSRLQDARHNGFVLTLQQMWLKSRIS